MKNRGYKLVHVIIIIICTSIISAMVTGVILIKSSKLVSSEIALDADVQNFLNAYNEINNGYYEKIDKSELINSAINGMMDYLNENYTTYLEKDEANNLISQLNSTYEGIGITVRNHEIVKVIPDSPAAKGGMFVGDLIVAVNGEDVSAKTNEELVSLIRNSKDGVSIDVKRGEETLSFSLKLETLSVPSVDSYMIENTHIGYLKIAVFSNHLTSEVKEALKELEDNNMEKLIIDLRGNTGGYLEQAFNIASIFTQKGKVIYSLESKNKTTKYKDKDDSSKKYEIMVLINSNTASASEILAAALKDSYGATLLGVTSFGKGKVQHTYSLTNGGIVKYTSSKWLRPNGECVDGVGIKPDVEVQNDYVYADEENGIILDIIDNQLNKAIELLSV